MMVITEKPVPKIPAPNFSITGKAVKAPEIFYTEPYQSRALKLDGCTVVQSCITEGMMRGSLLLSEHVFTVVVEGRYRVWSGEAQTVAERHEAFLVKKAHAIEFEKTAYPNDKPFEAVSFYLKDEFLKDFIALSSLKRTAIEPIGQTEPPESAAMIQVRLDERLDGFMASVKPYFGAEAPPAPALLRIKLMELLFNLSLSQPALLSHLLEFSNPAPQALHRIMETHFTKPLSLSEFAYLAGRSLASFKRDFSKVYGTSPAKWITHRRLTYARDLMLGSTMQVSEACYSAGFESVAHFSRLFKAHFGTTPSLMRTMKHTINHTINHAPQD